MKRTPMKRTAWPRRQIQREETTEMATYALKPTTKVIPRAVMVPVSAVPAAPVNKFVYVRSRALLKAVATLPCQCCGAHGLTQAAHSNQASHGKGRGIKASDVFIAALCLACHHEVDQSNTLSGAERLRMWLDAWRKTVAELLRRGLWPLDVPIPDTRIFH